MSVFFISDTHFGHTNMAIKRGFKDADQMFQHIKERWNSVVGKRDNVYILGDIAMESHKYYHLLNELKGEKYVVLGNHDMRVHVPELLKYVKGVAGMVKYKKKIFLTHCPIHPCELDGGRVLYNISGHLHGNSIDDPRYINVSCEVIDYTPKTLAQLIPNSEHYREV